MGSGSNFSPFDPPRVPAPSTHTHTSLPDGRAGRSRPAWHRFSRRSQVKTRGSGKALPEAKGGIWPRRHRERHGSLANTACTI